MRIHGRPKKRWLLEASPKKNVKIKMGSVKQPMGSPIKRHRVKSNIFPSGNMTLKFTFRFTLVA
jgi:hypothetical protein